MLIGSVGGPHEFAMLAAGARFQKTRPRSNATMPHDLTVNESPWISQEFNRPPQARRGERLRTSSLRLSSFGRERKACKYQRL